MLLAVRVRDEADLDKTIGFAHIAATWFDRCGLCAYGLNKARDGYEAKRVRDTSLQMDRVLAEDAGMFFPLPATQRASFWMKNCPLPLSAAFIDPEGIIQEIHQFQPHNTNAVVSSAANIRSTWSGIPGPKD